MALTSYTSVPHQRILSLPKYGQTAVTLIPLPSSSLFNALEKLSTIDFDAAYIANDGCGRNAADDARLIMLTDLTCMARIYVLSQQELCS